MTKSDELLIAANQGDAEAQFAIGYGYAQGLGVQKDLAEAARWWRKAADQGNPAAQFNLGRAHMFGEGVPVDALLPYLLFRAAARGYEQMIRDHVQVVGMSLKVARREAAGFARLAFPPFVMRSLQIRLACAGIGRFRAFQQSAYTDNTGSVTRLLDSGLDVNSHARNGATPLVHACRVGATEVVRLLFERGADVTVHGKGQYGVPPIHAAAQSGKLDVVELLLQHGADANSKASDGSTALMVAAIQGNTAMIRTLISGGADVNVEGAEGAGVLHAAAQGGHSESVNLLLAFGADPNKKAFKEEETALFSASQSGDVPTMKALVKAGADVNAASEAGVTPLHRAALNNRPNAVQYLLEAGADTRAKTAREGYTALHVAVLGHAKTAIAALLEAGIDLDEPCRAGATALQIAESRGDHELAELLRSWGTKAFPHR